MPHTLSVEPSRMKLRSDTDEPRFAIPTTLRDEPNFEMP